MQIPNAFEETISVLDNNWLHLGMSVSVDTTSIGLLPKRKIWQGEPCQKVCFDLLTGGLGDAVRSWRVAQAALATQRVEQVIYRIWPQRRFLIGQEEWFSWEDPLPDVPFFPAVHVFARLCISPYPQVPLLQQVEHQLQLPKGSIQKTSFAVSPEDFQHSKDQLLQFGWTGGRCIAVQLDDIPISQVASPWNDFKRAKCQPAALLQLAKHRCLPEDFMFAIGYGTSGLTIPDLRNGDLRSLLGLIAVADLLFCADSGPQHLAALVATPSVVLFGPSDPNIHLADPTFEVVQTNSCKHQPCGAGSLYGMPLETSGPMLPGHGKLEAKPLPCPNGEIGRCLFPVDAKV